jgi:hypothetical protein
MSSKIYFTLFFACAFHVGLAQQNANDIQVIAKSKKEGLWIRWAPTSATVWQLGNKYGYTVERFTLTAKGDLENVAGEKLSVTPLKPYTPAELEKLSTTVKEVSVIQELVYGEGVDKTYSANNAASVLQHNKDLENRFGIALLVCDLSPEVAKAAGLFIQDNKAEKGKRYIYRVSIAKQPTTLKIEPGVVVIDVTEEKPLVGLTDLKAEFRDKTVSLSWSTLLHSGVYSSYYIEKSEDGKAFKKVTDLPYVHMSEQPGTEKAFFVDSLETNNKTYYYRIAGNSPFGETGPPSNVASGEGHDDLSGYLVIREGKAIENKKVRIVWEFPAEAEKMIEGFHISRANKAGGPYTVVTKAPLEKTTREYVDETGFYNTYYQLTAIDRTGKETSRSFPFHVQIEDNSPPAIPVTLTGSIDKNGIAAVRWQPVKDNDLMGYSVFRSNSLTEEFVEITQKLIVKPAFTDTINIRVLNKKIFYRVIAVDKNYNASEFSEVLTLTRPDVVPPVAPVFTKAQIDSSAIVLQWTNSTSEDIANVELTRIEKEDKMNRTVKTFTPPLLVSTHKDASLTPGKTYQYKLTVYDSAGNKAESVSPQLYFETGVRSAVRDIKATVDRDKKQISFQWKNSVQAIRCTIYRKKNNEPLLLYQTLDGNVESFVDKNITINNNYSYKVQVIYPKGIKSALSEEIKVVY